MALSTAMRRRGVRERTVSARLEALEGRTLFSGAAGCVATPGAAVTPAVVMRATPAAATLLTPTVAVDSPVYNETSGTPFGIGVTVAGPSGGAVPTGTVSAFDSNGNSVGGPVDLDSSGKATIPTTVTGSLFSVTDLQVRYAGDGTYDTALSTDLTVFINSTGSGGITTPTPTTTLSPTVARSTLPTSVVAGDTKVHGKVQVFIGNSSSTTVKGKATVDLYASTSGVIDSGARKIGTTSRGLTIRVDGGTTVTVSVPKLPADLAAGTYTLVARVTDKNGVTSDSTEGSTFTVGPATVDLEPTILNSRLPSSVAIGSKLKGAFVKLKITNDGNSISSGTVTFTLLASQGIGVSTQTLFTSSKTLNVKAGKSVTVNVPITALTGGSAGTYGVDINVTDPLGGSSARSLPNPLTLFVG